MTVNVRENQALLEGIPHALARSFLKAAFCVHNHDGTLKLADIPDTWKLRMIEGLAERHKGVLKDSASWLIAEAEQIKALTEGERLMYFQRMERQA